MLDHPSNRPSPLQKSPSPLSISTTHLEQCGNCRTHCSERDQAYEEIKNLRNLLEKVELEHSRFLELFFAGSLAQCEMMSDLELAKVQSQSSRKMHPVEPSRFADEWSPNTTQNQILLAPNTSPSAPSVAERTAAVKSHRDSMPRSFRQLQSLMTSAQQEGNWPALKKVKNLCAEAHSTPREEKTDLQRYLLTHWRSPIWDSPNHQAAVESPLASSLVKNNPRLEDSVEVWASYLKRHPTSWPRGVRRNGAGEPHLSDLKASRVVAQLRPDTHSSADSPARRAQFMALVVQIFSAKGTYLHLLAGKTPHSMAKYRPYGGPLEEMTLTLVARHFADCGVPVSLADHELFDWSMNYLAAAPTFSALEDTAATSSRER